MSSKIMMKFSAMQSAAQHFIKRSLILLAALSFVCRALAAQPSFKFSFQNTSLTEDQRIQNVLSLMTLQEKIDLLGKTLNFPRLGIHGSGAIDSIPGSSGQFEGLHGLAVGGSNRWGRRSPGKPGPFGGTSTIPTTQFPQAAGLGETWDPSLLRQAAAEEGLEARYIFQSFNRGGLIIRSPNADLARDPRWGRWEESYGEDPYLTGTMAVAFVQGLQGDDPHHWLTASLVKHFLANSNEDGRSDSSSNFDSQLLHEYYAVPFRMAVEQGGADAIMTAYNAYNGIPMAASPLLRKLLMQRWGFNGMIDTDRGAITFMVTKHKYSPDMASAVASAIHAGVNQFLNGYADATREALQRHLITESDIDHNLEGVLRVMLRLGFLDAQPPVKYAQIDAQHEPVAPWDQPASKALALRVTQESIVLLKNQGHLLPLDPSSIHSIAVVGPLANIIYLDGYSGTPPFAITPLQGIRNRVGTSVPVSYSDDDQTAVRLAKTSDVAIVVVGNRTMCHKQTDSLPCPDPTEGQEGVDRQEISLKPSQERLIQQVMAVNPRTIVVLISSFPYTINWENDHVPAILHMTNNSEVEGDALASVIFGDYDPAGRLTATWPQSLDQLPPMMDYNIRDGRTYMYFHGNPLYPFGYGLSYTTFAYFKPQIQSSVLTRGQETTISIPIKNTGTRDGDEVVEMYVRYVHPVITMPQLELKGFQRIHLAAGQSATVHLPLAANSLMYWDSASQKWSLEKGTVEIRIGSSSRDIRQTVKIHVH
jgi:beta-glucosidase